MPKSPKLPPTETETALKAARKALRVLENGQVRTGIPRDRSGQVYWDQKTVDGAYPYMSASQVGNAKFNLAYHKIMHEAWQAQLTFLRERIAQLEQQQHVALLNVLSDH